MVKRSKFDEKAWYVDFIVGVIGLSLSVYLYFNYEAYLTNVRESMPSGKGAKFFMVIVKLFDNIGGKPMAIGIVLFLSVLFFWWAYRKYQKRRQ